MVFVCEMRGGCGEVLFLVFVIVFCSCLQFHSSSDTVTIALGNSEFSSRPRGEKSLDIYDIDIYNIDKRHPGHRRLSTA